MRHPRHASLRLPAVFVALRAFILEGFDPGGGLDLWEHADRVCGRLLCGDLEMTLLDPSPDTGDPHELRYDNQPIEIIPFNWNGGDGLHYGWAVLAPELDLDDHPCVSFAAIDGTAVWLGDDTRQALENLLAGSVAGWAAWHRRTLPSPADDPGWAALCRALDLHPDVGSPLITPGARSNLSISPAVPPGWRYEQTDDGIGVLAEAGAFAPVPAETDVRWPDDEYVRCANALLTAGHPASAVCVLKAAPPGWEVMCAMREAYRALGRTLHVERAEAWLRLRS